jgi:CrcB protein
MNLSLILAVAAGGAIGSVTRLAVGFGVTRLMGPAFPWGTLLVNIAGSFIIGVLVESFALRWHQTQARQALHTVGFCGGFTTFSTFSLDAFALFQRGETGLAAAYVIASVVLSIAALLAGLQVVRAI